VIEEHAVISLRGGVDNQRVVGPRSGRARVLRWSWRLQRPEHGQVPHRRDEQLFDLGPVGEAESRPRVRRIVAPTSQVVREVERAMNREPIITLFARAARQVRVDDSANATQVGGSKCERNFA
jgi:hypothetical protein